MFTPNSIAGLVSIGSPRVMTQLVAFATALGLLVSPVLAETTEESLATALKKLNPRILTEAEAREPGHDLGKYEQARIQEANRKSTAEWESIKTKADWEKFRAEKLQKLRASLGPSFPREGQPHSPPKYTVTGKIEGDGFKIENLVYESRPGLWVTANLYLPAKPVASMPGIIISHSHHSPKWQGELQDMGMTWARAGCAVLVPDHVGHGERRQHPFATAADYPSKFAVDRQDYYFRYDTGIQLQLVGESLAGWMAYDLMRGIDMLLEKGADHKRIILLGCVAGGGDIAAVTAALDERISCAVIFNFGGPQPETRYPLPENVAETFNYAGSGSWESTRNLRRSAVDGFLPWVIVGSIAPRKLIYAHEFSWDQAHDPVWKRLEKIWSLYDARESLSFAHGRGTLKGQPPEASHCNNIGPIHRELIHPAFAKWFSIELASDGEYHNRRDKKELVCMTEEVAKEIQPKKVHQILLKNEVSTKQTEHSWPAVQNSWRTLLGKTEHEGPVDCVERSRETLLTGVTAIKLLVRSRGTATDLQTPLLLLLPKSKEAKISAVVCIAQNGKEAFLQECRVEIAKLLDEQIAVCLPDLRGMGETIDDNGRGPNSAATDLSSTELMLGETQLGGQLRDIRRVIAAVRERPDIDGNRIALWGESFAAPLASDGVYQVPRRVDQRPHELDPGPAFLVSLGQLFEPNIVGGLSRSGGLVNFHSILQSPFVYIPHDFLLPGILADSEMGDVSRYVKWVDGIDRGVRIKGKVDGVNRPVPIKGLDEAVRPEVFFPRLLRESGR